MVEKEIIEKTFKVGKKTENLHKIHLFSLSPFHSLQIVLKEINRLGMIVEISHLSEPSMMQVLNSAKAPLLAAGNTSPPASSTANLTTVVPDHVLR